jgi:hypothetical protein
MRKLNKLLLIGLVILISSCDVLDTTPTDFISPKNYFQNEAEIGEALAAVYDILGLGGIYGGVADLGIKYNCTDEMFFRNSGSTNGIQVYNYTAKDTRGIWLSMFRGVERANILLENLDKAEMDNSKKEVIRGEVKFLRAYFYFIMVQNYGDVPLRVHSTESVEDIYYARTPAAEVYDFIYNEMVEAEAMVNPITEYSHAGKVTKSAIQGSLARVCLFMAGYPNYIDGKYEDALYWAEKLISSGLHQLNTDYSQIFINLAQDKYDTKESIWEVELYSEGSTDPYREWGQWGNVIGIYQTNVNYGYALAYYKVHEYHYQRYSERDMRRDWNIAPYNYKGNNTDVKVFWAANKIYDRYVGKYRREYELIENRAKGQTGINFPLLRYSDVLLMAAEAENELNGPTSKALSYLNEVRRRAYGSGKSLKSIDVTNGGSGYTSAPTVTISEGNDQAGILPTTATAKVSGGVVTSIEIENYGTLYNAVPTVILSGGSGAGATVVANLTTIDDADYKSSDLSSKDSFREIIQDERARELCFEGMRRVELIRWGIFVPKMKDLANFISNSAPNNYKFASRAADNISEKHNLLPIPEAELTLNKKLTQNPGW